jgi:hypothetical protein
MTTYPDDAAINHIATGLLARSLPKAEWTHAAHFAAAIWMARHNPALLAPPVISAIIRSYNEATGTMNTDSSGYHETITVASMRATVAHLARFPADAPLHNVTNALIASPLGRSDWLLAHWSRERLFSVAARREWVEPDLAPLPF